ncbi:helix-turn-helix domain-containing protein [Pedobacter alluvionis]|uniref:AraC family transcriptional regulator n=1 Tax=Pedobacter alluvionis TaxID=475253 RepID=A0A497Y086_9SPHI|nr:helix-turn-helix domain-containing protein [Pedobacter alluvionis]RLJ75119.1 helix-turn-helix protein [Pedobacter alluvionis]TFB30223.1 AraC family transcriptional regulator [Pedobacter alluvionis]
MNIFLLSIIERRIGRVMARLSQLQHSLYFLNAGHNEILLNQTKTVIDTYFHFFRSVKILQGDYHYDGTTIIKTLVITDHSLDQAEGIDKKLLGLIRLQDTTTIIPVNINISSNAKISQYLGTGIINIMEKSGRFYLQELSIPCCSFSQSEHDLGYLEDALNSESVSKINSLRELAAAYGKNYNHFQRDCKEYFGDTFHQFQNKLRMMDVLEDIMFTPFSFKEIAYRHNFAGYNSMYTLFHKKYHFPLDSIPRFKTES